MIWSPHVLQYSLKHYPSFSFNVSKSDALKTLRINRRIAFLKNKLPLNHSLIHILAITVRISALWAERLLFCVVGKS